MRWFSSQGQLDPIGGGNLYIGWLLALLLSINNSGFNGKEVLLNTNGSFKGKVVHAVNLFDHLIYSIDSLDERVFMEIRPGSNFETIWENLGRSILSQSLVGRPKKLSINFTEQKLNEKEVDGLKKFCDKFGIQANIKPVFPRNAKVGMYYDETKMKIWGRKNCEYPFQRLTIAWDGRVAPCCVPWDDNLYVGDWNKNTLLEIWRGEATLHPKFYEISLYLLKKGFEEVLLNTNGSFKGKVVHAVNLFDHLIYSIDSLDERVFMEIRPGSNFETIWENLGRSILSQSLVGRPKKLSINFTEQKLNEKEVDGLKKFCDKFGIQANIKPVFPRNAKVGMYYDETKMKIWGRKNCEYPFQRLTIAWDGRVAPCCVPWDDNLYVGDWNKNTLLEIWSGDKIKDIRKDAIKGDYKHPVCVNCTSWNSYEAEKI